MKAVIQRVKGADLTVNGEPVAKISHGLVVFLGVGKGDDRQDAEYIVKKIANLRIFEDADGKMNLSVKDVGGEVLLVSQFTLYGDITGGNRPDFFGAEVPQKAKELFEYTLSLLKREVDCKSGIFGADMRIEQINDGPVTIIADSKNRKGIAVK